MIPTNKAIIITGVKELEIRPIPLPIIGANEVLYEIKACSLCTAEQRVYSGINDFGFPLLGGHENAGIVLAIGDDVREFAVGDNVIATYSYCGQCEFCQRGQGSKCKHTMKSKPRVSFWGLIFGGGLAKYLAVPAWQLFKIPINANYNHYALTEPLACSIHSITKAKIEFGDVVLIIGAGIMGMFHALLAKKRGAVVIVSEIDKNRRAKATKNGIDYTINPLVTDMKKRVMEYTNGKGVDVIINAIGTSEIWSTAISVLAPHGRLIVYSAQDSKELMEMNMDALHSKEYEIIGVVGSTMQSNVQAVKLIANKLIDMEDFIDSVYSVDEASAAFDRAIKPNTYRVIINH